MITIIYFWYVVPVIFRQVQALQSQVVAYQHEISQFDIERSDWTMEKEALESVLMKLRTELKTKEEEIAVIQAEQVCKRHCFSNIFSAF